MPICPFPWFALLADYGFEVVKAEELGVRGAARVFAEASHIVAPHGAGLANLVFAPQRARVLEIYSAHLSTDYWCICNDRNLEYFCLQGKDANGASIDAKRISEMGFFERNGFDIHLDRKAFAHALDVIVS